MALRKSLDLPSLKRFFRGVHFLLGMSYLIFGSLDAATAQNRPQPPDLPPTVKSPAATHEKSRAELERELLLPLFLQERELLQYCSPDHPKLLGVQGRIAGIKEYLANLPAPPAALAPVGTATKSSANTDGLRIIAKPSLLGMAFEQLVPNPKPAAPGDISLANYSVPVKVLMHDREEIFLPTSVMSMGGSASTPNQFSQKSPNAKIVAVPLAGIPSEGETKAGSLYSNEVGLPKTVASERKPAPSLLGQQSSSASVAKTAPTTEEPRPGGDFLSISKLEFVVFLAAVSLGLMAQSAVLCLILRRYAARLVSAPLQQLDPRQPGRIAPAGSPRDSNSAGIRVLSPGIRGLQSEKPRFDVSAVVSLESTWAEVLQKREDEGARRRDEVFLQLFQRNAELREQPFETVTAR